MPVTKLILQTNYPADVFRLRGMQMNTSMAFNRAPPEITSVFHQAMTVQQMEDGLDGRSWYAYKGSPTFSCKAYTFYVGQTLANRRVWNGKRVISAPEWEDGTLAPNAGLLLYKYVMVADADEETTAIAYTYERAVLCSQHFRNGMILDGWQWSDTARAIAKGIQVRGSKGFAVMHIDPFDWAVLCDCIADMDASDYTGYEFAAFLRGMRNGV